MKTAKEEFKDKLSKQYSILIQTEAKEQKKRSFITSIILSLTLFSSIISLILTYKTLQNTKFEQENRKDLKTTYKTLEVTYTNGNSFFMNNIYNSYETQNPIIVTISNAGNTKLTYDIIVDNIETNIQDSKGLYYVLNKDDENIRKEISQNNYKLAESIEIDPHDKITYNIKGKYEGELNPEINNYYRSRIKVVPTSTNSQLLE